MIITRPSSLGSQLGAVSSHRWLPVIIVAVALVVAAILVATKPRVEGELPAPMPATVRTLLVEPSPHTLRVYSQGTVEPRTSSALIAEVSGMVSWVSPMMITGGRFNQGDVLLRVDARDYQNALSTAQSNMARAIAEQDFAQKEYTRLTAVYEKKLASDAQLQQAKRSVEIANAAVIAAQAGLEQAQRNLERTEIKAPFTGRVRKESVDLGQVVMRGGQLGELYATDAVEVRLPIADSQLRFLNPAIISTGVYDANTSPVVELSANFAGEEQRWMGRVVRAEGEIDQRSRLVHLVARVQNDQSDNANPLPVGLFVNAEIQGNTVTGLVRVPRTAIRANNQVLIVAPDNTLRLRTVDVLRFDGVDALISGGLQAGEQVAISALQFAVDGMPVIVQN